MSVSVDIEKKLGNFLLKVQFDARDETLALLGASGCGKSMTLKCIAGIEKPDRGRIIADGVTLFDSEKKVNLSPQERHVGLMFQNYALFPTMTVLQNIRAGAKREKDKEKRENAVRHVIENFGLSEFVNHYPAELSGGQQQRVALARILVSEPRVLLLDEPFSALDSHLRFRMEQELRSVLKSFKKTVLLVSHDRDEVYRTADSIAVMSNGNVECFGEKKAVFASPRTKNGAILTGCKNISAVKWMGEKTVYAADWGLELSVKEHDPHADHIGIRMHDIRADGGTNKVWCHVEEVIENPFSVTVMVCPIHAAPSVRIGWEIDKETWSRLQAEELLLYLPEESILLLKGEHDEK